MDAKDRIRGRTGGPVPGQASSRRVWEAIAGHEDARRRRVTLEHRWSRKLDEVIALTAACEGAPPASGDMPAGPAALPSQRLHERAAAAYEELGDLADAISRVDGWLARNRAARPL